MSEEPKILRKVLRKSVGFFFSFFFFEISKKFEGVREKKKMKTLTFGTAFRYDTTSYFRSAMLVVSGLFYHMRW